MNRQGWLTAGLIGTGAALLVTCLCTSRPAAGPGQTRATPAVRHHARHAPPAAPRARTPSDS